MSDSPYRGSRDCRTCHVFTDKTEEFRKRFVPGIGICEWKCPPVLRRILWSHWDERIVKEGDWCHEWQPRKEVTEIDGQAVRMIGNESGEG